MERPVIDELIAAMTAIVGAHDVLVDDDVRAAHETDWTRRWTGRCVAVVRPRHTEQVSAVLRWCTAHDVAVVPQGGNTGLVGGSIPPDTCDRPVVVVSTRGLDTLDGLDPTTGQITVDAGVTLAALAEHLTGSGWEPGVDLGARGAATIGGMAATNAGGTRVVRHGMMRRNVVGLEVVLADGSVVTHLRGLEKDNTGYDVVGLMVGSEGTLGVITRVRLRLVPVRTTTTTVLVRCRGWSDAVELAGRLRRIDGVETLEAVDAATTAAVEGVTDPSLTDEVRLLAEWVGDGDTPPSFIEAIGDREHQVAVDSLARVGLWHVRDHATDAIARLGVPHKYDVTVPLHRIAELVDRVHRLDGLGRTFVFGHVGDGNLHVNVLAATDGTADDLDELDGLLLAEVAAVGGSISAEHGIGRMKQPYLHLARSAAEIALFRTLKQALDPSGTLNPGVLLAD